MIDQSAYRRKCGETAGETKMFENMTGICNARAHSRQISCQRYSVIVYFRGFEFTVPSEVLSLETPFPKCLKCKTGDLVPLSDFGSQGAAIHYKAWVCTNPDCGFNLKIRNGDVYLNEPILSGAPHVVRPRS